MAYIDIKYLGQCETCRHHRSGKCDTWCEWGECYRPDVSKIPIADVTEAVRCSECKYAAEVEYKGCACKNEKTPWCNDEFNVYMNPTDFCSYGERRTDDGKVYQKTDRS